MQCINRAKSLAIFIGILLFSAFLKGYADTSSASNTADFAQGAHDWANNCARCHNLRAPTEFSPNQWQVIIQHMRIQCGLTGKEARNVSAFLMAQSETTQASSVNNQQATPQPAGTANSTTSGTTPSATTSLASNNKISNKNQNTAQPNSGLSGSVVYHQTCIVCHGATGKGAVPGAPDFTSKNGPLNKSDALLLQYIENGHQSPGSPMAMPPRGGNPKLTNQDLKNALSYIRNTFGK